MPDFEEVAPRVWVAHYDWMHVNITLIGGSDGLLMVDTHGSAAQARIVSAITPSSNRCSWTNSRSTRRP